MLERVWTNLVGRLDGPMHLRVILQPCMAMAFALRAGMRDARQGRAPYLRSLVDDPEHRGALLREGWKDVARVFTASLVMDLAYQLAVLRRFYPGEALLTAGLLALVPYLLVRGPARRAAGRLKKQEGRP